MKLFLKRDISGEHTRFIVCDHAGCNKYMVTGKRTSSTDKMILSSMDGKPLVTIRVAAFHVFYVFSISDSKNRFTMTATRHRTCVEYRFHGISWTLCRSSDGRTFEIVDADGSVIMTQSADRYLTTGVYELEIFSEQREHFCIAAAICADIINYADAAQKATV